MKRTTLSILGLALILLAGCVATSIYPFHTAKDLIFDPTLLGTWSDPTQTNASNETWSFEKLEAQTYKWVVRNNSETNEFDTHLFILGSAEFLDVLTRERHEYATPSHLLLRVKTIQPQLELQILDYNWLAKLVKTNPKAIRHIVVPNEAGSTNEDGLITLTADTAELQKFIRKHLNNTNAWGDPLVMKKQ